MEFDPSKNRQPPSSIEPTGFFTGVRPLPVISGVLVDYIATYVAMAAYIFGVLANRFSEQGQLNEEALTEYMRSQEGLTAALIIGAGATMLGGFVAARRAGVFEIKHGAFVGLGSLIVSFLEEVLRGESVPLPEWFRFVSVVAIIPAGAFGGLIATWFKNSAGSSPGAGRTGWPAAGPRPGDPP